jgi:WbqC-like protein family
LEPIYKNPPTDLSTLNEKLIRAICVLLGITTRITSERDYHPVEGKLFRAPDLCEQAGATTYVSGPAAKAYLDETVLAERGISVEWFDYAGYPEYPQLWGDFVHEVSILDLLFNCGPDAPRCMKHVR